MHSSFPELHQSERTVLSSNSLSPASISPDARIKNNIIQHIGSKESINCKDGCQSGCDCVQALYSHRIGSNIQDESSSNMAERVRATRVGLDVRNRVTFCAYPTIVHQKVDKSKDKSVRNVADNVAENMQQVKRQFSLVLDRASSHLINHMQFGRADRSRDSKGINSLSDSHIIRPTSPSKLMGSPPAEARSAKLGGGSRGKKASRAEGVVNDQVMRTSPTVTTARSELIHGKGKSEQTSEFEVSRSGTSQYDPSHRAIESTSRRAANSRSLEFFKEEPDTSAQSRRRNSMESERVLSTAESASRQRVHEMNVERLRKLGETPGGDITQINTEINSGSLGASALKRGQNTSVGGIYPSVQRASNDTVEQVYLRSSKDQMKACVVFGRESQQLTQSITNVTPMRNQSLSAIAQGGTESEANENDMSSCGSGILPQTCNGEDAPFTVQKGLNTRLTRWFGDYSRMRKMNLWVYIFVWFPLCTAIFLPAYLVNSQSLLKSWEHDEDIAYGFAAACMLVTLVPAIVIAFYLHKFSARPMVKSRGREFLLYLFFAGIFPCTILSLVEVVVFAAPGEPEWVYYTIVVLQNCTLNQFVIAIIARQRMIYRIFAARSYKMSFSYTGFTLILIASWVLSIVPYTVVFFVNTSRPEENLDTQQFSLGWLGSIGQTLIYWGLFVYYSYYSRGAHEKFSDFYQNIRLAVVSPTLFLALFIAASFYQDSPYASLIVPYLSWFIMTLYMVDTFPIPLYLCARGVDMHIELAGEATPGSAPVRSEYVQAQMKHRLSQLSGSRQGVGTSRSMSMPRRATTVTEHDGDDTDFTATTGIETALNRVEDHTISSRRNGGEMRPQQLQSTYTV